MSLIFVPDFKQSKCAKAQQSNLYKIRQTPGIPPAQYQSMGNNGGGNVYPVLSHGDWMSSFLYQDYGPDGSDPPLSAYPTGDPSIVFGYQSFLKIYDSPYDQDAAYLAAFIGTPYNDVLTYGVPAGVNFPQSRASLFSPGYTWEQLLALPAPGFATNDTSPFPVGVTPGFYNGWGTTGPYSGCNLLQAKNVASIALPYFIARFQAGSDISYFNGLEDYLGNVYQVPLVVPGVVYTKTIITVVSTGIIQPGQVIGTGQDIDLPFPDTTPMDMTNIGNSFLMYDGYFAVIGLDPGVWSATTRLPLGLTTAISPTFIVPPAILEPT